MNALNKVKEYTIDNEFNDGLRIIFDCGVIVRIHKLDFSILEHAEWNTKEIAEEMCNEVKQPCIMYDIEENDAGVELEVIDELVTHVLDTLI